MCSHSFTPTRKDRVLGTPTSIEWLRRVLLSPLPLQEKCLKPGTGLRLRNCWWI